ncbi:hypothetical protein KCU62_g6867, partial [Aureobasidium sp. EXF-3399]
MEKQTTKQATLNVNKATSNSIIRGSVKLLPWLMLLHNLLYIVFPSQRDGETDKTLAWSNFTGIVYLIGIQAAIDGGLIAA